MFIVALFITAKIWKQPVFVNRYMDKEMYTQWNTAAAAKSLQSCPTLCDPIDGSPPGSPVPGILQARTLEWVAISFSTMEYYSATKIINFTICSNMDGLGGYNAMLSEINQRQTSTI